MKTALVEFRDAAGNVSSGIISDSILLDRTPPTAPSTPTEAGDYSLSPTVTFNWSAPAEPSPGSGIVSYQCQVGASPGASDVLDQTVSSPTLSQAASGPLGETLFCRVRAIDLVGNASEWSGNSDGIYLDAAGLSVTLTDADGANDPDPEWTNAATVTVQISNLSYTPQYVDMDEDPNFNSAIRSTYSGASYSYTFNDSVAGTKTVHVRLANDSGAGQAASDDIGLDTIAPAAPDAPVDEGDFSLSPTVGFSWTAATDPGGAAASGVASYVCEVGTTPGASDVLGQTADAATLDQIATGPLGETLYSRVRAVDAAGNVGEWSPDSDGIFLDTPPGAPTVIVAPTTPRTLDRIIPTVEAADPDLGDSIVSYRFEWLLDDVLKSTDTALMADLTSKSQQWVCRAWAEDTYGAWSEPGETSFTIQNTPPTQPFVMIKPHTPNPDQDLIVDILVYSTDPDGDEIAYDFEWYKSLDGGRSWIQKIELKGLPQVSNQYINSGELWKVLYIPYEKASAQRPAARPGEGAEEPGRSGRGARIEGKAGWDQVYVGDNAPPTFSFESILALIWSDDVKLNVSWAAGDADGDAVVLDLYWTDFAASGMAVLGEGMPIEPSSLKALVDGMPDDGRPVYLHAVATDSKGAVTQVTSDPLDIRPPEPARIDGTWILYP